jgi:hypothetical protein
MLFLTLLLSLQSWSFSNYSAESDYLDNNLGAFYEHVEGKNASYLRWMELESSRIVQPIGIDTETALAHRYSQLRTPSLPHASMVKLLAPTSYTSAIVPLSYVTKPANPYFNYYRAEPTLDWQPRAEN